MKAKQFFFILLGSIVLLLGIGVSGYVFALKNIEITSARLSQQRADLDAADTTLNKIQTLQLRYKNEILPIIPLIDAALPRSKNQTELLAQLQRIAADSNLSLTGVNFLSGNGLPSATSQTIQAGSVLALPVSFQLIGSYSDLQGFLKRAERLSRFTNVTTLAVTRADKTKPITYSMTINAYIKP